MAAISTIELKLRKLGYNTLKNISSKRTAILTNQSRIPLLQEVAKQFEEEGAQYIPEFTTASGSLVSSSGVVKIGDLIILAKPLSRQGGGSAGLDNEDALVKEVQEYITKEGWASIAVHFVAGGKTIKVPGVRGVQSVGSDTANRKKSDVNLLTDSGPFPISIKKTNAEYWESADRIWGAKAKVALDFLAQQGDIELVEQGGIYTFGKNVTGVAIPATDDERTNFVFGADLLGRGIVVKQTFSNSTFSWDEEKGILQVRCKKIFQTLNDVKNGDEDVYLFIRKDRTRRNPYPGMRVLATYKSRVSSSSIKTFPRRKFGSLI